jgi:hypothetical protein
VILPSERQLLDSERSLTAPPLSAHADTRNVPAGSPFGSAPANRTVREADRAMRRSGNTPAVNTCLRDTRIVSSAREAPARSAPWLCTVKLPIMPLGLGAVKTAVNSGGSRIRSHRPSGP